MVRFGGKSERDPSSNLYAASRNCSAALTCRLKHRARAQGYVLAAYEGRSVARKKGDDRV